MTTETTNAGATTTETTADTSTTAAAATDSTTATESVEGKGQGEAGTTGTEESTEAKAEEKTEVPKGAPEAYEPFTMPEGFALEGERHEATIALFKDADLSQVQAQKLIEGFIKFRGDDAQVLDGILDQRLTDKIDQWAADSVKEFGADFDTISKDARAGRDYMLKSRPNLLDNFDKEGWSNHPDAIAVFAELGRIARGSPMRGMGGETTNTPAPRTHAERIYGDSTKK